MGDPSLFALRATRAFGEEVARHLGLTPSEHEEREFEDGEHKARPLESVRGKDVYVVQSLHGGPEESGNDKLCRLLFFLGALRDADARRITAVVPYLCYARKDRRTKPRDPITTRYVAALFEAVGTDRVVTMDVHNVAAFENAARHQTENLEAKPLFVRHFQRLLDGDEVAVVSPDPGGVKRAEAFREALEQGLKRPVSGAFLEKKRSGGVVSGSAFAGDVANKTAVVLDDLVSSGTTLLRAAKACRERGAKRVFAAATHGLFMEGAEAVVADPALDGLVVANTVPPFRLPEPLVEERVVVLDAAPLFAQAIQRIAAAW